MTLAVDCYTMHLKLRGCRESALSPPRAFPTLRTEVGDTLGQGACGAVFAARDRRSGRRCAIKRGTLGGEEANARVDVQ